MKRSKSIKALSISFLVFISTFSIVSFQNCSMVAPTQELAGLSGNSSLSSYSAVPTFAELSQKVITPKCLACHSSGLHNFSSYADLMASGTVVAGNLSGSTFYQQILTGGMPLGRTALGTVDVAAVADWIQVGALQGGGGAPANLVPLAVTAFAANAASPTSMNLSWILPAGILSNIIVERSSSPTGPFTAIATLAGTANSYIDTGLTASLGYSYRVKAVNVNGASPYSSVVSAVTSSYPPANPSNLMAAAVSQSQINLTWMDNSTDETGFVVERGAAVAGPFTVLFTTSSNVITFLDLGLSASTTYYYRLSAVNAAGKSAYTNTVSAMTSAPALIVPAAPSTLTASGTSSSQISLDWLDNSANETGFKLERAIAAMGPFTLVSSTAANVRNFVDSGLAPATSYYYRAYAFNAAGSSTMTSVVMGTTMAASASPPMAPATVSAVASSGTQVNLSWVDSSNNETGFKIERGVAAAGPFTLVTTVGSGVTTYTDTGLVAVSTYYYRVMATNAAGNSASTASAAVTTFGTFTWIKANVSTPKCLSCHSGAAASAGIDLSTYAGTLNVVIVNNSTSSRFYASTLSGSMPKGSSPLTTVQLNAIKTWIDSGALNN